MEELERFLEELPGRMEELSLLGGKFEQSAERFLHLPAGRLGQLFRGTGLQGGGQVKEILLPQLLQNRFRLRRGSCARLLWLFYFHCLDFELTGNG